MGNDETLTWQDVFAAKREVQREEAAAKLNAALSTVVPNPELPVGETAVYRTVAISSLPDVLGDPVELEGAIDLLNVPDSAHGLAEGVLLTHEQGWRMKGVTLGKLLHSLCLAPGEVTQVAVTGWQRSTSGQTSEQLSADEEASQAADRSREITGVTQAVAAEQQVGNSSSSSYAAQASGGFNIGVANASTSANFGMASTASFNLGSRSVSADSNQSVRQTTQQHAANARGQRSVLVQEVAQSETEQFTTRVVANYNHMHALNMLYFEVLQVYELSTRVTDAQRCLFLPMEVMTFDETTAELYAPKLADAAAAMGLPVLAKALRDMGNGTNPLERLKSNLRAAAEKLSHAVQQVTTTQSDFNAAMLKFVQAFAAPTLTQNIGQLSQEMSIAGTKRVAALRELELCQLNLSAANAAIGASYHQKADVVRWLNERKLAFNQALWMQLEPPQIAAMIGGKRHHGVRLLESVDPHPIAVVGHFVGFRWHFAKGQEQEQAGFLAQHLSDDDMNVADRDTVVLPTGGVFAEAVLGRANSAEKLDLTRFWRWDDTTIPILPTAIGKLHQIRRAQLAEARPGTFGDPVVRAQPLPAMPAGPSHALASIIGTSLFRDASGADAIQELLKASQEGAAKGSNQAMEQVHESISAILDNAEQLLPKVADALKQGAKQAGNSATAGGKSEGGGKLDASNLGALKNVLGEAGGALDVESLLGSAAKLGMFL